MSDRPGPIVAQPSGPERPLRVLRIYHSGVFGPWRDRERAMRRRNVDVTLVSPRRWNEGGSTVALDAGDEPWVMPARTVGRHPYVFVFNPWPIARLLWRHRFDVIDVHEEPASLAALEIRLLAWIRHRRTPLLLYGAENIEKHYPIPFRWIERSSLRRAAAVYPCNREAGEILVRKGFRGVVHQMDLGVALDQFAPAPRRDRAPDDPFLIGFAGRIETRKGVPVILDALATLDPRFHLELAGDGPERVEFERRAASMGLADRVRFLGSLSHDRLADFFRRCDALAVPSQTTPRWVEQFGRVAVEAMAAGLPVVVSDSGSLPGIVGDAGVVVPEADQAAWAEALGRLADDPTRAEDLRERGIARSRRFGWDEIAAGHIELYREVCS